MTIWIKQGVMGDLSRPMERAKDALHERFHSLYITSIQEGNHKARHWGKNALDYRFDPDELGAELNDVIEVLTQTQATNERYGFSGRYETIKESDHFHTEWEPILPNILGIFTRMVAKAEARITEHLKERLTHPLMTISADDPQARFENDR